MKRSRPDRRSGRSLDGDGNHQHGAVGVEAWLFDSPPKRKKPGKGKGATARTDVVVGMEDQDQVSDQDQGKGDTDPRSTPPSSSSSPPTPRRTKRKQRGHTHHEANTVTATTTVLDAWTQQHAQLQALGVLGGGMDATGGTGRVVDSAGTPPAMGTATTGTPPALEDLMAEVENVGVEGKAGRRTTRSQTAKKKTGGGKEGGEPNALRRLR